MMKLKGLMASAALAAALAGPVAAQSVEEFYSGKTINMIIGYSPGGGNDAYARAVARHIGRFIPGEPEIVAQNMPGGGSLIAANHLANAAPQDGTVLGLVSSTLPLDEVLGGENIMFEASDFNWIGRIDTNTNVTFARADAEVKSFEDAREKKLILAATGAGSTLTVYPQVMNAFYDTKFDIIMGYEGSAASMLALERGEVEGHTTSTAALATAHPEWLTDGSVNFLVQYAAKRHPDLSDTPTVVELAETEEDARVMRLTVSGADVGKSILTTPGVPDDRVAALREAFNQMVADAEFQADLEKLRLDLDPLSGEELQALVAEIGDAPAETLDKVRAIWPN